jgi:hypothetical protein
VCRFGVPTTSCLDLLGEPLENLDELVQAGINRHKISFDVPFKPRVVGSSSTRPIASPWVFGERRFDCGRLLWPLPSRTCATAIPTDAARAIVAVWYRCVTASCLWPPAACVAAASPVDCSPSVRWQ